MDVQCLGGRGVVPDVVGPSHEYMRASPGCWQIYNELIADSLTEAGTPLERWHHVDCFAVQHPGGAQQDRRQRQSVAVHLVALCMLHEFGQPPEDASATRGKTSRHVLARVGCRTGPSCCHPRTWGR